MIKMEGDFTKLEEKSVEFFLAYKKKAVFNVVLTAKPRGNSTRTVQIYDNRLGEPFEVGSMWWDGCDYTVSSPRIQNEKFAKWNSSYRTKTTKELNRGVRNALDFIKPFTWDMVAKETKDKAQGYLRSWADEPKNIIVCATQLSQDRILEEVKHAISMGTQFHTYTLNKAKQVVIDNLAEAERRASLKFGKLFIVIDEQGRYCSDSWMTPKTDSELPESVLTKLGLLKLLDTKPNNTESYAFIGEVGLKVSDKVYWIYDDFPTINQLKDTQ